LKLDWNSFFKLRKRRRYWQMGSSVATCLSATVGGIQVLTMQDVEPLVGQIPLDPFITLGLMTFGFGALGWVCGPVVGAGIFNTLNSKVRKDMTAVRKMSFLKI
jgi:import inner membrane translocase subunit TIM23